MKIALMLFTVMLMILSLSQIEAGEPQKPADKAPMKDASEKLSMSSIAFTGKPPPPGVSEMPSGINLQI